MLVPASSNLQRIDGTCGTRTQSPSVTLAEGAAPPILLRCFPYELLGWFRPPFFIAYLPLTDTSSLRAIFKLI
jgi:hypothetical protein